jgi:hypothetical protein
MSLHPQPEDAPCLGNRDPLITAVLPHIANKFPSVPLAHAANMKDENTELLLENMQYEIHTWNICGDLKICALLLGLQLGYTKFCCLLFEWDITDRKHHYIQQVWSKRESLIPGLKNVNTLLISLKSLLTCVAHQTSTQ